MDLTDKYLAQSFRYLSFRPRSEKEVRDYLQKKKASPEIIETIIAKLKDKKFINDQKFAKWFIEQRSRIKPKGQRLIIIELKQKGISKDVIDAVIQNSEFKIQNDREKAREIVERKIEKYRGLTKQEVYQKLGGLLSRRGFDYDVI